MRDLCILFLRTTSTCTNISGRCYDGYNRRARSKWKHVFNVSAADKFCKQSSAVSFFLRPAPPHSASLADERLESGKTRVLGIVVPALDRDGRLKGGRQVCCRTRARGEKVTRRNFSSVVRDLAPVLSSVSSSRDGDEYREGASVTSISARPKFAGAKATGIMIRARQPRFPVP